MDRLQKGKSGNQVRKIGASCVSQTKDTFSKLVCRGADNFDRKVNVKLILKLENVTCITKCSIVFKMLHVFLLGFKERVEVT